MIVYAVSGREDNGFGDRNSFTFATRQEEDVRISEWDEVRIEEDDDGHPPPWACCTVSTRLPALEAPVIIGLPGCDMGCTGGMNVGVVGKNFVSPLPAAVASGA